MEYISFSVKTFNNTYQLHIHYMIEFDFMDDIKVVSKILLFIQFTKYDTIVIYDLTLELKNELYNGIFQNITFTYTSYL